MARALRFFFYGTLMAGSGNAVARTLHDRLEPLGRAHVRGMLHAVPDPQGWYPALLPGDGRVAGWLHAAGGRFTAADLSALDAYEDIDPALPEASLYLRRNTWVACTDGSMVEAQAYWFNQPLPEGAMPIPSGDFAAFVRAWGMRVFGAD